MQQIKSGQCIYKYQHWQQYVGKLFFRKGFISIDKLTPLVFFSQRVGGVFLMPIHFMHTLLVRDNFLNLHSGLQFFPRSAIFYVTVCMFGVFKNLVLIRFLWVLFQHLCGLFFWVFFFSLKLRMNFFPFMLFFSWHGHKYFA